jgi:hypothetical protein
MATREIYKVIAQANPAATTLTDVYTVPAVTAAVISSIIIANRNSANRSFRISIAVAGATDAFEQYIAFDETISGNAVYEFTIGATLGAGDVVRVYVSDADLSVNVFGTEIANV